MPQNVGDLTFIRGSEFTIWPVRDKSQMLPETSTDLAKGERGGGAEIQALGMWVLTGAGVVSGSCRLGSPSYYGRGQGLVPTRSPDGGQ